MGPTERLAKFLQDIQYEKIPREAIEICKRHFLDCMGAALAEVVEAPARMIREYVRQAGGTEEARVIGSDIKTSASNAVFANAVIAHAISFDDAAPSHPTVTIFPVLLALGEKYGFSGKELLTAQLVGYDIFLRLNEMTKKAQRIRLAGWHPTGFFGTLAASAATAKLLKLDVEKTRVAFGIAGSLSGGLSQNIGTMTMSLHAGNSARNGLMAGFLAQAGFTADREILEGEFGLLNALCGRNEYDVNVLTSDLGKPFKVISPGINIKFYPSCFGHHRAIDAILHLVRKYKISADNVETIECDLQPDNPRSRYLSPKSDLEAKYSIGYGLAVALLDGKLGIEAFFPEKIFASETQAILAKVKHVPQAWSSEGSGEHKVKVRLKDGKEYSYGVAHRKGEAKANPLTREELLMKYRTCARRVLTEGKLERSIEIIEHLEEIEDINELMSLVTM